MVRKIILDTIKKYNLINKDDVVVVAVSGGPDSMCLLDNLVNLQEKLQIKKLVVAHLNHMLREEAKNETAYVEEYCKKNNIECFIKFVNIKKEAKNRNIGEEEAGRIFRYDFFEEVFNKVKANKIAIAHNLNDNAETILMHLLRGSGISGLSGIKPYREGKYIRPIIKCNRTQIEEYCEENKLDPKYDKSNNDNTYTRNKIRNELIPYLKKEFNPNIIETLDRLSELINDEQNYIKTVIEDSYKAIIIQEDNNKIIIDLKKFNLLNNVIKSNLILKITDKLFKTTKGLEKKHIEDLIKLCSNNIGNKYLTPNKKYKVTVNNKKVYFERLID